VVIRAAHAAADGHVRIEVDYGEIALSAAELKELFVPKSQSRAKGLTLGLSLARALFVLHAGSIDVTGSSRETPVAVATLPTC
jgi:nitrogen-specific signal transduction histidine kinase